MVRQFDNCQLIFYCPFRFPKPEDERFAYHLDANLLASNKLPCDREAAMSVVTFVVAHAKEVKP